MEGLTNLGFSVGAGVAVTALMGEGVDGGRFDLVSGWPICSYSSRWNFQEFSPDLKIPIRSVDFLSCLIVVG
jgi:hypothetical protein